ncbi:hypothetical protein D0T53_11310 [Dysgonomonas sp. 216]|uniref:hypothetical protein n=1 Tax=Dysgonomonas sp. 216 TaxID=2302934 RepID=UPI0013D14E03|nr:hypothetical protein [Dysgonomonas sp. 216]NDW19493.1 hypothetical protein [Dysgonomonas sp. 216]
MEQSVLLRWQETTKQIYQGVLLYTLANLLYSIFDSINSLVSGASNLMSFAESGTVDTGIGFLDVICWIFLAGLIYGYYLFLKGLDKFKPMLSVADAEAVGKIRLAVILAIVAAVVDFIPFLGWVGTIINIVSFIMMMIGYSALKNSPTFPNKARNGASKLFTAMILMIVAAVFGFIPFIGWVFALVLDIIVFFMILSGWATIKNSTPDTIETQQV